MKPLAVAIAIALSVAAVADAATCKGRTSQSRKVKLVTNDRGFPVQIGFVWKAKCSDGGRLTKSSGFYTPFKERTRDFVRDSGTFTASVRDEAGRVYRVRITGHVRAHRIAPRRWRGTFGARAVLRRNGRFVSRCKTGALRWHASR